MQESNRRLPIENISDVTIIFHKHPNTPTMASTVDIEWADMPECPCSITHSTCARVAHKIYVFGGSNVTATADSVRFVEHANMNILDLSMSYVYSP